MNEIKILKNSSNKLLNALFQQANEFIYTSSDLVLRVASGESTLITNEIVWYFPFQAQLFDVDDIENTICFITQCTISNASEMHHCFISGYLKYESISDEVINLKTNGEEDCIFIVNFKSSDSSTSIRKIFIDFKERLDNQLKFVNQSRDNNEYLEKVMSIEDLEDLDLADEKIYIQKIKLLQQIATGGRLKEDEIQRVWGEYSIVSQITTQPILMNKATSIRLSKEGVQDLMDSLNEKYKERVKRIVSSGKIKLLFSPTLRGHHSGARHEIVLSKLGDWRFGYMDNYCAETIFHEFAHALDVVRPKHFKSGKSDVHKHDFVRVLDMILLDYADFINSNYSPINQREQILTNNQKLIDFYAVKDELEEKIRKEERIERQLKEEKQSEIYSSIGLTNDNFPIHAILGDNANRKLEYLKYAIEQYKDYLNKSNRPIYNSLSAELNSDSINLNKEEIELLVQAVKKVSRNNFVYALPFGEQLNAGSYISDFQNQLIDLSQGKLKGLEIDDKIRVRSYDEADILKKRGKYED